MKYKKFHMFQLKYKVDNIKYHWLYEISFFVLKSIKCFQIFADLYNSNVRYNNASTSQFE